MARNTSHPRFVPGHGTHDNEAGPSDRRTETGTRNTIADIMTDQNIPYTSSTRRGTNSNTAPTNSIDGAHMNGRKKNSNGYGVHGRMNNQLQQQN
ncbi:hypothetical protein PIB30_013437 [Stylosanthes scabra]|uniref:Uncharacterized protein n=1 Tax=Stylosanthes scabra TaxID=79078 RepID=A0ABU6X585_9FABA|nr:hypothetical protein [Stylosanthes scabra]